MKADYLEVTYRHGRALAAYYFLPRRSGDTSHRTVRAEAGLLIDFSSDGRPIGIEITAPGAVSLSDLNKVLDQLGMEPISAEDFAPLAAA